MCIFALSAQARLQIHPQSSLTSGGSTVVIDGVGCWGPCDAPKVYFGGVESPAVTIIGPNKISAVTPPYPFEQLVEVRVAVGAESMRVDNDFVYRFDRVPVLIPVWVESFSGSRSWMSELWVYNGNDIEVSLQPTFCFGLQGVFHCGRDPLIVPAKGSRRLPALASGGRSIGAYLYVPRKLEPKVTFDLHLAPLGAGDAGVAVPVVRAPSPRDTLMILNVPTTPESRVLLRVYVQGEAHLNVRVFDLESGHHLASQPLDLYLPTDGAGPPLAALMVATAEVFDRPEVRRANRVGIEVTTGYPRTMLWAMATVTNNETQRVTLFTP